MTRRPAYQFLLYVAGDTQNSSLAVANLTEFCHTQLPGRYEIEVVDVFLKPKRALADGIFMTPTLLKVGPKPVLRIVGTLSHIQVLRQAIGLGVMAA
jgi:circadian clock protein KaiB